MDQSLIPDNFLLSRRKMKIGGGEGAFGCVLAPFVEGVK
jgi:hypothetical protein